MECGHLPRWVERHWDSGGSDMILRRGSVIELVLSSVKNLKMFGGGDSLVCLVWVRIQEVVRFLGKRFLLLQRRRC